VVVDTPTYLAAWSIVNPLERCNSTAPTLNSVGYAGTLAIGTPFLGPQPDARTPPNGGHIINPAQPKSSFEMTFPNALSRSCVSGHFSDENRPSISSRCRSMNAASDSSRTADSLRSPDMSLRTR